MLSLDGVRIGDTGPVTFRLHRGEMVALAGLRGAGQEEIGRALFGMRTVDAGRVELLGSALNVSSPMQAIAAGISLVAGDRLGESVVPTMSVRENLFINPFNIGKALLAPYLASEEVPAALRQAETFDMEVTTRDGVVGWVVLDSLSPGAPLATRRVSAVDAALPLNALVVDDKTYVISETGSPAQFVMAGGSYALWRDMSDASQTLWKYLKVVG